MPCRVRHILNLYLYDDIKLIGIIKRPEDAQILQSDLEAFVEWSNDWRIYFHSEKCKFMEVSTSLKSNNKYINNPLFFYINDVTNNDHIKLKLP